MTHGYAFLFLIGTNQTSKTPLELWPQFKTNISFFHAKGKVNSATDQGDLAKKHIRRYTYM